MNVMEIAKKNYSVYKPTFFLNISVYKPKVYSNSHFHSGTTSISPIFISSEYVIIT